MKNVLIKAYTSLNLGDDLFVKILCDRYPEIDFYIICQKKYSKPFENIINLTVITPKKHLHYFNIIQKKLRMNPKWIDLETKKIASKCDAVIHIGGSIFMENDSWKYNALNYENLIMKSNNFFVIGSNFGPYQDKRFQKVYLDIFSKITHITFRDKYSYSLFPEIDHKTLAPDVVFNLDTSNFIREKKENHITMSIIDLENRPSMSIYKDYYEKKILNTIIDLIAEGKIITLMSFCNIEGDIEAINRIYNKLNDDQKRFVKVYDYDGDIVEAINIISESEGIVATRFHSMILGWLFNLSVFPIIYNEKMENVINDTEFEGDFTTVENIKNVKEKQIIDQLLYGEKHNIDDQIKHSIEHFKPTDNFMLRS